MTSHSLKLKLLFLLPLFLVSCLQAPPAGEIVLPALFSDHMVLQQNRAVPIWGKATPNSRLKIRLDQQIIEVTSNQDSTWSAMLDEREAGGPFRMDIISVDTISREDIYFGEVWLASGQSNMQWSVRASNDSEREIADANHPMIRLFTVERTVSATPVSHIPSDGWRTASPETIADFSAVAYYFGRKIQQELDVPVGLIHSSWGGSPAEAWTRAEALDDFEAYAKQIQQLKSDPISLLGRNGNASDVLASWRARVESGDAGFIDGEPAWASPTLDETEWDQFNNPAPWEPNGYPGYDGIGWYRTNFTLADTRNARFMAPSIDDADITWVNGNEIGTTDGYNVERSYNIPEEYLLDGLNQITIRVLDTGGDGGLRGDPASFYIQSGSSRIPLSGSWKFRPGNEPGEFSRPLPVHHVPTALYNAMIAPLIPYGIQGAIWYQGESNAGRAYEYRSLFKTMIEDWRTEWNDDFSFLYVQLANFRDKQKNPVEMENWPELREAQTMALDLPKTGMAVTIDIGEADDIHPRNKQDVGLRLALAGLQVAYDRTLVYSGPAMSEVKPAGDALVVHFNHTGDGLATSDGEPVKGFAIASADQKFYWAEARIEENTVVVYSPEVTEPVAVRYGWADNPVVNLVNSAGLPASPFRSDNWPGLTQPSN